MNDSNMNDIINKFNNILKDKNIDLGNVFDNEQEEKSNPMDFNFDLDTKIKFKNIFGQINNNTNPRNALLRSLKPFLREERKEKLEQNIKIANILGVLSILNENNGDKK